jgi:CRP/FNR family transcriptional regulator, cyclic AMP receptor protein
VRSPEGLRLLSQVDILRPLSQEDLRTLGSRLPITDLEQDQIFHTPVFSGAMIFLLLEGRIRIYKVVAERELTLIVLESGTMFGEMSLTAQGAHEAYTQAMQPSKVCVMSHNQFRQLVMEKPEVGLRVAEVLSERQALYWNRMADISFKEIPARLAGLILQLVESEGVAIPEGYRIPTRYTHEQLGAMIGARRVAVTRAVGEFRRAGAVELRRRHIYVTDIKVLENLAGR